MTAPVLEQLLTAEEFFELPDPLEGGKMELVAGRVVTNMPVSHGHGERVTNIVFALKLFLQDRPIGRLSVETGFLIRRDPDSVRAPDVAFLSNEMAPEGGIPDEGFVPCPPTLAVEVISPDDRDEEVSEKLAAYLAAGVQRVWIVRKKTESVTVHRPDGTARIYGRDETLTSDEAGFSVPGFALPVGRIFA